MHAPASQGSLLIIGASARAAAQSALRAGYQPWCIDLFADRDLQAIAPVRRCTSNNYPAGLLDLLPSPGEVPARTPVLFTGAMENHLPVVRAIEARFPLQGSSSTTMAAARRPDALRDLPPCPGLCLPALHWPPDHSPPPNSPTHRWLRKPLAGSGGRGVHWASPSLPPDDRHYHQQYIPGQSLGVVFLERQKQIQLIGASLQIIGNPHFHALQPFHYVGSVGPIPLTQPQQTALLHLAQYLVHHLNLRGIFGVDLILDAQGNLWPIEINPRYPASVEIHERATGRSALIDPWPPTAHPPPIYVGKAIAYYPPPGIPGTPGSNSSSPASGGGWEGADSSIDEPTTLDLGHRTLDFSAPDLYHWFKPDQIADLPEPGEPLLPRHPICTLVATGPSPSQCLSALHHLADQLYSHLKA